MCGDKLKDPVFLLQELLKCPSVTPSDAGAQILLKSWLEQLGFTCHKLIFGDISNLYATRIANGNHHFLFAGHSDVVPTPQPESWKHPPFAAIIENGYLYGRGAQDMKGGIAAFIAAIARLEHQYGTISLAITGDEEGTGINGTVKLMQYMHDKGEKWDMAIVGEPSCKKHIGDTIKIGRRGSLNAICEVEGISGHVAYPDKADNAAKKLITYLNKLVNIKLDAGSVNFPPSNIEITEISSGGEATNLIPAKAKFAFNIRFNDLWNLNSLKQHISYSLNGKNMRLIWLTGASESFITKNTKLVASLSSSIKEITNISAKLDTSGGTSDARFIKNYCPVVEFGLCGGLMHKVNEAVSLNELENLTKIYHNFLKKLDSMQ